MEANHRIPGRYKGQSLVEFALVLPIFLGLMVVVIDLGLVWTAQIMVINAAWEGARAGATITDAQNGDEEIMGAARDALYGFDGPELIIEIDPAQDEPPRSLPFPAPRGECLTVTVQYPLRLSIPPLIIPVTGRAVTRMEYQNP